ncbi:ligase-associated DNA damage response endonuclease PdeM [Pukyongiella litopenaei]|uniref:ligase-associated DNA damage response endonuclease PdeM n=1 Tax=Pukyongiella litopenaei TaxID=2605946 RepID=UPI003CC80363
MWWPDRRLLCVSDLHLGKSGRHIRRGGTPLPPYDTADTLARLAGDLARTGAETVVCLGDSFDDPQAASDLGDEMRDRIAGLQAGRRWIWIEGNHDPGPVGPVGSGGAHLPGWTCGPVRFRHIARPDARGEISGHYHPKLRLPTRGRTVTRAAFLVDEARMILPAYGTYTGGLHADAPELHALMGPRAIAILTGATPRAVPLAAVLARR